MLLSLKKNKRNIKKKWNGKKIIQRRKKENGTIKLQQNKRKQQQHIKAPAYITGGDAIRQLL